MNLHVRSQYQLRTEILTMLDDTSNARWSDAQVYTAINQALAMWGGRVLVPHLYQPASYAWDNNTYEYALPSWMDEKYITPQMRRVIPYAGYPQTSDGTETWVDVPGWSVEPTTTEGRVLRFQSLPYEVDARILYWSQQYQLPTSPPVVASTISNAATTATLGGVSFAYPSRFFLAINLEIMSVTFTSKNSSVATIALEQRAMFNSYTPTNHATNDLTYFCVAVTDERLFVQLHDQAMAILHRLRFGLASPEERSVHGQMIQLYQKQADMFWKTWTPNRPIKLKIDRRGML